jgi:hypothetical protein
MLKKILFYAVLFTITATNAQFTGSFNFIMTQEYQNGNTRTDTISYTFAEAKSAIIIHARGNQPDLRLIFHPGDSTITGLFEQNGRKGGYILPMNEQSWPAMHYALRDYGTGPRTQLHYTNQSKEILGYTSHEIRCEEDDFSASLWIAPEIPLSLTAVLAYQFVGVGEDLKDLDRFSRCGVQGFAMETYINDKKRNATITLKIEDFSDEFDKAIFNTEGFQVSDMRKQ